MKEYKIVSADLSIRNGDKCVAFESQLNQFAKEGWKFITFVPDEPTYLPPRIVLERDKSYLKVL